MNSSTDMEAKDITMEPTLTTGDFSLRHITVSYVEKLYKSAITCANAAVSHLHYFEVGGQPYLLQGPLETAVHLCGQSEFRPCFSFLSHFL